MKRIIVLKKKEKRKMTRPQIIFRNLLLIVLMIASVTAARSGTVTEEQAYEKQLNALGITQTSIEKGAVRVISDEPWDSSMEEKYVHYDFEPSRRVVLETAAGGNPVNLWITIGRRGFLWYDSECTIEYPEYGTSGTYNS